MKKQIKLDISEEEFLDDDLLEIKITPENLKEWCLALCLLKENLLNEVVLLGKQKVSLSLNNLIKQEDRAFWEIAEKQKKLMLSQTEIGYWLKFFLEIYRDGFSNINHLDTEAIKLPLRNKLLNVYLKYDFLGENLETKF